MNELEKCRAEIDAADAELTAAFIKRMEICGRIAEIKKAQGLPVLDEKREAALLARVRTLAGEELADDTETLYREILRLSRARQEKSHG